MGVSLCDKHGSMISTLVSIEVFELFDKRSNPEDVFRFSEVVDGNLDWGQTFVATKKEMEAIGVLPAERVGDENVDIYDNFISSLKPVCSECFALWVETFLKKLEVYTFDVLV